MRAGSPSRSAMARYLSLSALQDNYVWILQEAQSGKVAIVDPSEAAPVAEALEQRCQRLPISFHANVALGQLLSLQDLL